MKIIPALMWVRMFGMGREGGGGVEGPGVGAMEGAGRTDWSSVAEVWRPAPSNGLVCRLAGMAGVLAPSESKAIQVAV